jgi:hypothetical protein
MTVMEEKMSTDPRIGQPTCCGLGRKPFFSGPVDPFNYVDDSRKVATYEDCLEEEYEWRIWTGMESICVMCIRFSPARCTSI